MKLIIKTSLYYIGFSVIGFIIGGFVFYHIIFSIINSSTNDDLRTEKELIEEQILHSESIPDFSRYFGHQILVKIYDHKIIPSYKVRDTLIRNEASNKEFPFIYLIASENRENKSFSIEIFKPLINSFQLSKDIFFVMLLMVLISLISLILINYLISRRAWSTFYNTLIKIKDYDIQTDNELNFNPTNITEFAQLNEVLIQMTNKINNNYINLKEFTENASHEIQTPLAIMKSKLELLVQGNPLNDVQMENVQSMYNAVTRLSKLNTNLVLLSKIENSQFRETAVVNLNQLIGSVLINLEDLIIHKGLLINKEISANPIEILINPTLAEVLIINLISNSIKHNIKDGHVNIILNAKCLIISNSGHHLDHDPETMFNRFKKDKTTSVSLGLGLSIVQKIACLYQMRVSYTYETGIHTLTLKFNK